MSAFQPIHNLPVVSSLYPDGYTPVFWEGLRVQSNGQPLNLEKLARLADVCLDSLTEYSRLTCFEFFLKLPPGFAFEPDSTVAAFLDLLIQKLHDDLQKRQANGGCHYSCRVRFLWVPQQGGDKVWNYKVVMLLNSDAYFALANKYNPTDEMQCRIKEAWMQVIRSDYWEIWKYVSVPRTGYWYHNCRAEGVFRHYERLIYRLSSYAFIGDGMMGSSYR